MTSKKSPETIRNEITTILAMWKKNNAIALPDLDFPAYQALVERFQTHDERIQELDLDRDSERVSREEVIAQLSGYHTRLKSLTRGLFGPDSAQMSQVGLVRRSDRKVRHESTLTASSPAT